MSYGPGTINYVSVYGRNESDPNSQFDLKV